MMQFARLKARQNCKGSGCLTTSGEKDSVGILSKGRVVSAIR